MADIVAKFEFRSRLFWSRFDSTPGSLSSRLLESIGNTVTRHFCAFGAWKLHQMMTFLLIFMEWFLVREVDQTYWTPISVAVCSAVLIQPPTCWT